MVVAEAAGGDGGGGGFHPPYVLGGRVAFVVGLVRAGPLPVGARVPGFEPVCVLGRPVAVVVLCQYDGERARPPAHPLSYDEVIVALLLRRRGGLRLAIVPLTMRLNEVLPVEEGREHYSLPKEYDPTLRLAMGPGVRAIGQDLELEAVPLPRWRRWAAELPCGLVAIGARALTAVVPVYGVAARPIRRAIIALRPASAGALLALRSARVPGVRFHPLWAQSLGSCDTWLGPPRDLPLHPGIARD